MQEMNEDIRTGVMKVAERIKQFVLNMDVIAARATAAGGKLKHCSSMIVEFRMPNGRTNVIINKGKCSGDKYELHVQSEEPLKGTKIKWALYQEWSAKKINVFLDKYIFSNDFDPTKLPMSYIMLENQKLKSSIDLLTEAGYIVEFNKKSFITKEVRKALINEGVMMDLAANKLANLITALAVGFSDTAGAFLCQGFNDVERSVFEEVNDRVPEEVEDDAMLMYASVIELQNRQQGEVEDAAKTLQGILRSQNGENIIIDIDTDVLDDNAVVTLNCINRGKNQGEIPITVAKIPYKVRIPVKEEV